MLSYLLPLVLLLHLGRSAAVQYSDLEHLGVSCPTKDSCAAQDARSNFTDRNCECDAFCGVFGDCCVDAHDADARGRLAGFRCVAFGETLNRGVYAVNACPVDYVGPPGVRTRCAEDGDLKDPLMSTPVTDPVGGITYKNRYCAECNGAPAGQLLSWLIGVHCDTLVPQGANDSEVWRKVSYDLDQRSWGARIGSDFHPCELTFEKPNYLNSGFRLCRANIISGCPASWRRLPVRRACDGYMAVVFDADNAYRNVHCALCNGRPLATISCYGEGISTRQKNKSFSFALLLDVNRSDGDLVGISKKCPEGQKFDPFFNKCRELKCALPGFKLVNGKCKKET